MTLTEAKAIADNPDAHAPTDWLNSFLRLKASVRHVTAGNDRAVARLERRLDHLAERLEAAGVKAQPPFSDWRSKSL